MFSLPVSQVSGTVVWLAFLSRSAFVARRMTNELLVRNAFVTISAS